MTLQQDYLNKYIEELSKTEILTPEKEKNLWISASNGNHQSFTAIATAYQPLVFSQVRKFKVPYETIMELIQEGTVALIESAEKYNYQNSVAFSVFATPHIRGAMINYLKKESSNPLLHYFNEKLTDDITLGEIIPAPAIPFDNNLFIQYIHKKIHLSLQKLPTKEQQIITMLYLEEKTAKETAKKCGLSLGSIYRIERKGKQRLRGMLSKFIREIRKDYYI